MKPEVEAGRRHRRRAALLVGIATAAVFAACGPRGADATPPPPNVPAALSALPVTTVAIAGVELHVVVAATPGARSRGLMGVHDFGGIDGMAFVFDAPTETGFYMKDVLVPLDIAFIGADGRVLDVLTMPLCSAEPCPIFHASAPFQWALETPAGRLSGIRAGEPFDLRPLASP